MPSSPAIPSGGVFGYPQTIDPLLDQSTHALSSTNEILTNPTIRPGGVVVTPYTNPLDQAISGAVVGWWDGADPNGTGVVPIFAGYRPWIDKSPVHFNTTGAQIGNLTQATPANQPTWTPNVLNGMGAYVFPGVSGSLYLDSPVSSALAVCTHFIVVHTPTAANQIFFDVPTQGTRNFDSGVNNAGAYSIYNGTGGVPAPVSSNDPTRGGTATIPDTCVNVFCLGYHQNGSSYLRKNGAYVINNASIGAQSPTQTRLGANFNAVNGLQGSSAVFEFIIVNRALQLPEIQRMEAYLTAKWIPDQQIMATFAYNVDTGTFQTQAVATPLAVNPGPANSSTWEVVFASPHGRVIGEQLMAQNFTPAGYNCALGTNGFWVVKSVPDPNRIIVGPDPHNNAFVPPVSPAAVTVMGQVASLARLRVLTSPGIVTRNDLAQTYDGGWSDRYGPIYDNADYSTCDTPDVRNGGLFKWRGQYGLVTAATDGARSYAYLVLSAPTPSGPWTWQRNLYNPNSATQHDTWGNCVFIDPLGGGGDGNLHVIGQVGNDNIPQMSQIETHPLTNDLSGPWSPWVAIGWTGARQPLYPRADAVPGIGPFNASDPAMVKVGGTYYLFYKRDDWVLTCTAASWAANVGSFNFSDNPNLYVGGHIAIDQRGENNWTPAGWGRGIWQILTVSNSAPWTITASMPIANPGVATVIGRFGAEFIELATSTNLTGPYQNVQYGNWLGINDVQEAPYIIDKGNGAYDLYLDSLTTGQHVIRTTAGILPASNWTPKVWSGTQALSPSWPYNHQYRAGSPAFV